MCERDSVITARLGDAALARRLARRVAHERRQAGEIGLARAARARNALSSARTFWPKRVVSSASRCITAAWRACSAGAELGAGADEVEMEALEDAALLAGRARSARAARAARRCARTAPRA